MAVSSESVISNWGYNFDKRLLNRIKVQSLRLYTNVQNPKTWSRNGGYTPEVGGSAISFGIDGGGYPMPTVYTIGFYFDFSKNYMRQTMKKIFYYIAFLAVALH